jgi:hypothetical protein
MAGTPKVDPIQRQKVKHLAQFCVGIFLISGSVFGRRQHAIIAGIETMHMIKKGQLDVVKDKASSAADMFYSLAF